MNCAKSAAFIQAYVDRELAGGDREAFEQHLLSCEDCARASRLQGRFKAAVRGHLPRPAVPERVQRRLEMAIAAAPEIRRRWFASHPRFIPVAAAAVAVVVIGAMATSPRSKVLDQALRTYHAGLPMDVVNSNCAQIANWFRGKVDFTPPHQPFGKLGNCEGGRLVNVQDRFGAYFLYQVPTGRRLGMMVWGGDEDPIAGWHRRVMRGHDIYMGSEQGASFAAFRGRDGLNYVLTTDLDEDALGSFVQAVFEQRR